MNTVTKETYFRSGNIRGYWEETFGGVKHGPYRIWNEKGEMIEQGRFKNGRKKCGWSRTPEKSGEERRKNDELTNERIVDYARAMCHPRVSRYLGRQEKERTAYDEISLGRIFKEKTKRTWVNDLSDIEYL
jgi:hypothetical protein